MSLDCCQAFEQIPLFPVMSPHWKELKKSLFFQKSQSSASRRLLKQTSIARQGPLKCVFALFSLLLLSFLCGSGVHCQEQNVTSGPDPSLLPSPSLTAPADIEALLAIQDYFGLNATLGWNTSTDPCTQGNGWNKIGCSCENFDPAAFEEEHRHCGNYMQSGNYSRVIFLELKGNGNGEDKLKGTIPAEIGQLNELRWLSLEDNDLEGEVPKRVWNLTELRYLSLADNRLSGTVPDYFSSYEHLMSLHLHGNNFSGSLSENWCREKHTEENSGNETITGTISNNLLMCGKVPDCLVDVLEDATLNTYLYIQSNESDSGSTEVRTDCDDTPPICAEEVNGCKLSVPPFWTLDNNVTFNYTSFTDPETGISHYEFNIVRVVNATSNDRFRVGVNNTVEYEPISVKIKDNVSVDTNVTKVTFNSTASEKNLIDGVTYRVRLTAFNFGGPPLNHTIDSAEVLVDRSPPDIDAVFNNEKNETIATVSDTSTAGASWTGVVDADSDISTIDVFLEMRNESVSGNETGNYTTVSRCNFSEHSVTSCKFYDARLEVNKTYRVKLKATNGVGLSAEQNSSPFIVHKEDSYSLLGLSLGAFISVFCSVVLVLFILLLLMIRYTIITRKKSRKEDGLKADTFLRDIVFEVSDVKDIKTKKHEAPAYDQVVAFVVTDIESSTAHPVADGEIHRKLLDIRNKISCATLSEFSGHAIETEDDSFSAAFPSIVLAMCFALQLQETLLRQEWWKDVLSLPNCSLKKGSYVELVDELSRIRLGLHWAKKTGINSYLQPMNGSRVFTGPDFDFVRQIADACNGGQILLSHQAWLELYPSLSHCEFPTISQIGFYSFASSRDPQPLYEVSSQLGKTSSKSFPPLRKLQKVAEGRGVSIIPLPAHAPDGCLTFLAVIMKFHAGDCLPMSLAEKVYEVLATRAQLFQGSIVNRDITRVRMLLAFQDPLNAIRFAHITQLSLVLMDWPKELLSFCGPQVPGEKGIPLFHGPRVAMAIHTTDDFVIREICGSQPEDASFRVHCEGPGEAFVRRLSEVLDGGQVVLSERAWSLTQNTLPGQYKVINHGKHKINTSDDHYTLLVEINPLLLRGRKFKSIESADRNEKGYFDAPNVENRLAILFVEVPEPKAVVNLTDHDTKSEIQIGSVNGWTPQADRAFFEAIGQFTCRLRSLLHDFNGYECKEMERGKFALAFENLQDAIVYSCQLQAELHSFNWSEDLLSIEEFSVKRCSRTNRIIKRGLAVKISIAYGFAGHKEPTNIGRADYFGVLPNLSARLLCMASPGQILIFSEIGMDDCGIQWITKDSVGVLSQSSDDSNDKSRTNNIAIEILKLGDFLIRGMKDVKRVYQARMSFLVGMDEERTNMMLSSSHQRSESQKKHHPKWLHATTSRFKDNYQRLLFSNSFSTRRGGGGHRMKMQNIHLMNRQQERGRQVDGDGSNSVTRNSPHSSVNGCGFRVPTEIQLRSISKPSSSGS